ncbi:MAG: NAD(P)-dependent alcohol dehydrogenase [Chloroflexaceae bacterium]|nr:NAD(P)-dependent alcohol dehydrogenase [Chloroflexaceae bacterium]
MVYTQYGPPDVLRLEEIAMPTPGNDEVLVRVYAASANASDWHLLRGVPFPVRFVYGLFRPKYPVLGADMAGRVEAVGASVTRFRPGDAVFGDLSAYGFGGYAEYVCVKAEALVRKPDHLSFAEAAAVPSAALTALQGLRDKGKLQPGQNVLIHGASGGVGSFAVQFAKAFGAEVTAVCSTRKMAVVRSLGADHVIDYNREDFARTGRKYNLIFAANGNRSIFDYRRVLLPNGIYVMGGGAGRQMVQAMTPGPLLTLLDSREHVNLLMKPNPADLAFIGGLLESRKIVPIIDRCFPLDAVPEAIRYLEAGQAAGKVVITTGATV